jgi:hypothetical protein
LLRHREPLLLQHLRPDIPRRFLDACHRLCLVSFLPKRPLRQVFFPN